MGKIEKVFFQLDRQSSIPNENIEITGTNSIFSTWFQGPQKASYRPNCRSSFHTIRKREVWRVYIIRTGEEKRRSNDLQVSSNFMLSLSISFLITKCMGRLLTKVIISCMPWLGLWVAEKLSWQSWGWYFCIYWPEICPRRPGWTIFHLGSSERPIPSWPIDSTLHFSLHISLYPPPTSIPYWKWRCHIPIWARTKPWPFGSNHDNVWFWVLMHYGPCYIGITTHWCEMLGWFGVWRKG